MKTRTMALAALAVAGAGAIPTTANAQFDLKDTIETVGAMMLADRLGIDPNLVLMAKMGGSSSIFDMGPAFAMSPYTTVPPQQLYAMNSAGLPWDQVALLSGVPAPTYQILRDRNQFDNDVIWADEIGDRYSVSQTSLNQLHNAGFTWQEIARASVISQETGVPLDQILYEQRSFGTYARVAPRYYSSIDPVYIPPRRRVVNYLPEPRYRTINWRNQWDEDGLIWTHDNRWKSKRWSHLRPVVMQWSPVRVVKQPITYKVIERPGIVRYEPIFVRRDPVRVRYASVDPIRVVRSPFEVRDVPRVFRADNSRYVRYDDGDRRAQRLNDGDRYTDEQRRQILIERRQQEQRDQRHNALVNKRQVQDEQQRRAELLRRREAQQNDGNRYVKSAEERKRAATKRTAEQREERKVRKANPTKGAKAQASKRGGEKSRANIGTKSGVKSKANPSKGSKAKASVRGGLKSKANIGTKSGAKVKASSKSKGSVKASSQRREASKNRSSKKAESRLRAAKSGSKARSEKSARSTSVRTASQKKSRATKSSQTRGGGKNKSKSKA